MREIKSQIDASLLGRQCWFSVLPRNESQLLWRPVQIPAKNSPPDAVGYHKGISISPALEAWRKLQKPMWTP